MSKEAESCSCGRDERRSERDQNISIPEPIMTEDKKYKCPIDQAVYDDRKSYEQHCAEEHDVL